MRIGHESTSYGHRQKAGFLHLHDSFVFKALAPLSVFDWLSARRWGRSEQGFGEFLPE